METSFLNDLKHSLDLCPAIGNLLSQLYGSIGHSSPHRKSAVITAHSLVSTIFNSGLVEINFYFTEMEYILALHAIFPPLYINKFTLVRSHFLYLQSDWNPCNGFIIPLATMLIVAT